ncbi:hypothetical protein PM082_019594 [Marasmius tenuissimus]|nr:hypothetical protein PM082_019594 [Marasmius tenuissimus]
MDPVHNFKLFEDWESFTPSMKGYVDPKKPVASPLNLDENFIEMKDRIEEVYTNVVGGVPLVNSVDPGLTIEGVGNLRLPLEMQELERMREMGSRSDSGSIIIPATKVTISNPGWGTFFDQAMRAAFSPLCFYPVRDDLRSRLHSFAVIPTGAEGVHVDIASIRDSHTLVGVMLLSTNASTIEMAVSYSGKVVRHKIEKNSRFKMTAVVACAGYDYFCVTSLSGGPVALLIYTLDPSQLYLTGPSPHWVSGVIPEMRDFFAEWKYSLVHETVSKVPKAFIYYLEKASLSRISELQGDNAKLIAHLVTPAKAYGFRWFLGHARHELSCEHELEHEYKEYVETEEDYEEVLDWDMDSDRESSIEWEKIIGSNGVALTGQEAKDMISEVTRAWHAHYSDLADLIIDQDDDEPSDKTVECDDDTLYSATIRLTHIRYATFLIVVPE